MSEEGREREREVLRQLFFRFLSLFFPRHAFSATLGLVVLLPLRGEPWLLGGERRSNPSSRGPVPWCFSVDVEYKGTGLLTSTRVAVSIAEEGVSVVAISASVT